MEFLVFLQNTGFVHLNGIIYMYAYIRSGILQQNLNYSSSLFKS